MILGQDGGCGMKWTLIVAVGGGCLYPKRGESLTLLGERLSPLEG